MNPRNPDDHFSLGAYSLNFHNQLEAARQHFQRSIELNPQHLEAYLGLMKTSLAQSNPGDALRLAERIQSTGQENKLRLSLNSSNSGEMKADEDALVSSNANVLAMTWTVADK